jgi:hypothetical protein
VRRWAAWAVSFASLVGAITFNAMAGLPIFSGLDRACSENLAKPTVMLFSARRIREAAVNPYRQVPVSQKINVVFFPEKRHIEEIRAANTWPHYRFMVVYHSALSRGCAFIGFRCIYIACVGHDYVLALASSHDVGVNGGNMPEGGRSPDVRVCKGDIQNSIISIWVTAYADYCQTDRSQPSELVSLSRDQLSFECSRLLSAFLQGLVGEESGGPGKNDSCDGDPISSSPIIFLGSTVFFFSGVIVMLVFPGRCFPFVRIMAGLALIWVAPSLFFRYFKKQPN